MGAWPLVLAYVVLRVGGDGPELKWRQGTVPFATNQQGSADLSGEEFAAVEDGFRAWNAVCGIGYKHTGLTARDEGDVIDGSGNVLTGDSENIVTWIESGWPYSTATIAITWNQFFTDGTIAEADIVMNGEDYFWTTQDSGGSTDVESITAHEAGHFLGLDHTSVQVATMFPTVVDGDISLRSLESDDKAGARHLYGSSGGGGCGCNLASAGRGGAPGAGLIAGVMAVLALAGAMVARLRSVRLARVPARVAAAGVAVALLALAPSAHATVVIDQTIEQLAADSDLVVHGTIESVETVFDGRVIKTINRLVVSDVLAGPETGAEIEIITPGGTLPEGVTTPNGVRGAIATGIPTFAAGDEVVLFARHPVRGSDLLTVTGLQMGKFLVSRDGVTGEMRLYRDLSGLTRMHRTDLGMEPASEDDVLEGVRLEDLARRVRAAGVRTAR